MLGRLSRTSQVGLALILVPMVWLGGWAWWTSTRTWVPLNVPVSLSKDHIPTRAFTIDVESTYSISVQTNAETGFEPTTCPDGSRACSLSVSLITAPWSLAKNGNVLASGEGQREQGAIWNTESVRILGRFHADPGHYTLNVDVQDGESRLDSHQPRLVVFEDGGKFENSTAQEGRALSAFLLLAAIGVCTLIRAAILRRQERLDTFARVHCLTHPGAPAHAGDNLSRKYLEIVRWRRVRRQTQPRQWPFFRASWFGLIAAIAYITLFAVFAVYRTLDHEVPKGIRVRLLRPEVRVPRIPGIQPIVIRVEFQGYDSRPNLYVNWKLVRSEDFDTVFSMELGRRPPDWPTYVLGDADLNWKDVVEVIDRIRGFQAQVVLLTRGMASALARSQPRSQPEPK